jgi:hypothetical protein
VKKIKYIIFFLFLCLFSRACSLYKYEYCKIAIGKKSNILASKDLLKGSQGEVSKFKVKYKTKGLLVVMPIVPALAFNKFCDYARFSARIIENTCSSFLYCVQGKRGPPEVNIRQAQ